MAAERYNVRLSPRAVSLLAVATAFAVGAVIRSIPQLQFPYAIGFDSPIYMNFGKIHSVTPTLVRPFEELLAILYIANFDMMTVMEVLPPIVYGFLGVAGYTFSRKVMKWERPFSLVAALNLCLSIALLRISWDMHDLMLGMVLLLFSISYLEGVRTMKWRWRIAYLILATVTLVSHQLVTVLFLGILLAWALQSKDPRERRYFGLAIFAGLIIFVGLWYSGNTGTVFDWIPAIFNAPPFTQQTLVAQATVEFPLYLFLFLIPAAVVGFFKQRSLSTIMLISLAGSLASLFSPSFLLGGVLEWRWVVLMGIPIAFYSMNGLRRILRGRYVPLVLLLVLAMNVSSYAFMGLTTYPTYYTQQNIMPITMVGASMPEYNIPQTLTLFSSIPNQSNSTLIVNGNWVGWARFYTSTKVVTFGGAYPMFNTVKGAVENITNHQNLYLLWWDTATAKSLGFYVYASDGSLILFKYNATALST